MKISDLHTHPSLKPFHNRNEKNNTFQNIWNGVLGRNSYFYRVFSLVRNQVKETARDSQSNLNEFISGDLQTGAIVIHPIERGWFMRPAKKGRRFWKMLIRWFLNDNKLPYLAASLTGVPLDTAKSYIEKARKGSQIDYFHEEAVPEYQYIVKNAIKPGSWQHEYAIVKDHKTYQRAKSDQKLPLFLSIEGGHALIQLSNSGMHQIEYEELNEGQREDLKKNLAENVKKIKGATAGYFEVAHTPIYVTLVHMYQNFLAGHARSYKQGKLLAPGVADLLDQRAGLNRGLTDLGLLAIDLLTSDANGSRILIDVKHLSAKARKEYYQIARKRNLPIIGSHVAMAGTDSFADDHQDKRKDHDRHYFSRWSINFSDEDVRAVHETDGIMGIAIHEGRMPGGLASKELKKIKKKIKKGHTLEEDLRKAYLKLAMSNIFQAVAAINEKSAWTRFMIGSDYDGIMDPFDIYPKTGHFKRFMYDMEQFLMDPFELTIYSNEIPISLDPQRIKQLMFGYTPTQIRNMIALENFESFIERHF